MSFVSWSPGARQGRGKCSRRVRNYSAGDGARSSPAAHSAASRLAGTPSFARMAETWWSTVRVNTTIRRTISAFDSRRRPRRPAGAGSGPPGRTGSSGGRDQARRRWCSRGGTGRRGIARVGQDRRPCAASTPRRRIQGRPVGNPGAKPFYPRIGGQRRGRQVQIRYVVRPGGRGRLHVREGCSPHRCCRDGRSGLWCQGSWAQAFVLLYR